MGNSVIALRSPCCCDKDMSNDQVFQKMDEGSVNEWQRGSTGLLMKVPAAMRQPMVASRKTLQADGVLEENTDQLENVDNKQTTNSDNLQVLRVSAASFSQQVYCPPPEPEDIDEAPESPAYDPDVPAVLPAVPGPEEERLPLSSHALTAHQLQAPEESPERAEQQRPAEEMVGMPWRQWEVVLQKTADIPLGVDVATYENSLVVNGVRDGLVKLHNKCSPVDKQVRRGDVVVAVNNTTGDGETLFNLAADSGGVLSLLIRRIIEFRVDVNKTNKLGIGISVEERQLLIMEIAEDGVIAQYNSDAPPGRQILPGDHIVEVNGAKGIGTELQRTMATCTNGGDLSILVVRE